MTDGTKLGDDDQQDAKGEYEVGYRRPPIRTRFQPGHSGNPKGRRKGVQRSSDLLRKALNRSVTVTVGGKPIRMTSHEFILMKQIDNAKRGDLKAAQWALAEASRLELATDPNGIDSAELSTDDAEIMQAFLARHLEAPPPPEADMSTSAADDDPFGQTQK